MKLKSGALIAAIVAIAISGTGAIAIAQPANPDPGPPQNVRNINLTADQRAKLQQIREETRQQMESILTPEQKQQLQTFRAEGNTRRRNMQAVMNQLNLSEEQKAKLREIRLSSRQRMEAVFTPEQLEQIRQRRNKG